MEQDSMATSQQHLILLIINLLVENEVILHIFHLYSLDEAWNVLKGIYKST